MPGNARFIGSFEDRSAGKLGANIADNAVGLAVNRDQRRQLPCHPRAKDAGVGDQG